MTTQHTSGTWEISKHGTPDYAPQYGIHAGGNDFVIVKGENAKADSFLIAAAPPMLSVLKRIAAEVDGLNIPADLWEEIHSSIAQAESPQ